MPYTSIFLMHMATGHVYVCVYFVLVSKWQSPCQSSTMVHVGHLDSPDCHHSVAQTCESPRGVFMFLLPLASVFSIQTASCSGLGTQLCLVDISTAWYHDTKMLKWSLGKLETSTRRGPAHREQLVNLISSAEKGHLEPRYSYLPSLWHLDTCIVLNSMEICNLPKCRAIYTNTSACWAPTNLMSCRFRVAHLKLTTSKNVDWHEYDVYRRNRSPNTETTASEEGKKCSQTSKMGLLAQASVAKRKSM